MIDVLRSRFECLDELNGLRAQFLQNCFGMHISTQDIKGYLSDLGPDTQSFALDESSNSMAVSLRSIFLVQIFGEMEKYSVDACNVNSPYPEDMFYDYATELAQEGSQHFEDISVLRSFYLLLSAIGSDFQKAHNFFKEVIRRMLLSNCADFNLTPLPDWEKGLVREQIFEILRGSYESGQFFMQRDPDSEASYEEDMASKQQILEHERDLFLNFAGKNMSIDQITDAILGDASKINAFIQKFHQRGIARGNN